MVYDTPMQYYKNMFLDILPIATYEVPYNGSFMLEANGQAGWDQDAESSISKLTKNFLPTELPILPEWKKSVSDDYMEVETNFTLYNHDLEALTHNFKFLWTLASGAFWMQLKYRQVSPNVYTIHIPGIAYLFYTTMHIIVEQKGNRRLLTEKGKRDMESKLGDEKTKKLTFVDTAMFPDAYSVNLKFKSLVPNNYNAAMYYFIYGKTIYGNQNKSNGGT